MEPLRAQTPPIPAPPEPDKRRISEHAASAAIFAGLLILMAIQAAGALLLQEELHSFVVTHPLLLRKRAPEPAATTPIVAPAPDLTRPIAVMIDNHPDALPQSGVAGADYVFETLVEGGLTRLMAVFQSAKSEKIGPVRSARPYFMELARGMDAVYVHIGGSDAALKTLHDGSLGLNEADEMKEGYAFWRDDSRKAPHNAYTSTDKIRSLIGKFSWRDEIDPSNLDPKGSVFPPGTPAEDISVYFGNHSDTAEFHFDAATASYIRDEAGRQDVDLDGAAVKPRTVVVIETDEFKVADPQGKGLIGIRTTGSGKAEVFRDGEVIEGEWKKASPKDPLAVVDKGGTAIPFADGQVWYCLVAANLGGKVSYK